MVIRSFETKLKKHFIARNISSHRRVYYSRLGLTVPNGMVDYFIVQ